MNICKLVLEYIEQYPEDEPIFIEDIKEYFVNELKCDIRKIIKKIYVYINRLVKEKVILQFMKGVYYKPTKGIYGNILRVFREKHYPKGVGRQLAFSCLSVHFHYSLSKTHRTS